ncbi:hypothetical protein [Lysinibacillus piscis]|uniref:DUF1878 family protein n=1 Tax=Lysinibacillus piscis TaxID=2518931 RepID=A0ABQ5NLE8_9BACI|nr:hypothetical protein [Lysinibacillus sp. KH24]GLC89175.1 hypothetical protein LYSBPC_23020 [Lysinibacillus sp. KH24]
MQAHNEALEVELAAAIQQLIHLELEENYAEMNQYFARLLAKLQAAQLIDYKLDVLVEPQAFTTEICLLLESLQEAKKKPHKRHGLLTHRHILKIWLRKHPQLMKEFLPQLF